PPRRRRLRRGRRLALAERRREDARTWWALARDVTAVGSIERGGAWQACHPTGPPATARTLGLEVSGEVQHGKHEEDHRGGRPPGVPIARVPPTTPTESQEQHHEKNDEQHENLRKLVGRHAPTQFQAR